MAVPARLLRLATKSQIADDVGVIFEQLHELFVCEDSRRLAVELTTWSLVDPGAR